ncbi:hypothetical protein CAPTEDRAFT_194789 [Capitella teleta]|uniref:Uncharacterized protein n=1 Tax=Capitella teleta TaxID=283909 RepID=R7USH8_CAPTE|nr:hypothetical protein CAPTEDRAFT_194789 [Capitella teleta]|eukprot:ELU06882.1 hypothetical protein CAPTEDRAFT_194789 [Capitella teleta]
MTKQEQRDKILELQSIEKLTAMNKRIEEAHLMLHFAAAKGDVSTVYDLRAARARDCFHLPRGNQRILRGQKANVQLANTGGQKFAENKEPESKRIHHCQKATIWKAPILCIYD